MSESEKVRTSGESPRPAESSVLPTVNPAAEQIEPPKPSLHPAFYVMCAQPLPARYDFADPFSAWIAMSSGVILFNKWVLDTKNFSKSFSER